MKKNKLFLFFIFISFLYCKKQQTNNVESLNYNEENCKKNILPKFDTKIVKIIDPISGKYVKDTIINKIAKSNPIYKPCRKFIYLAEYFNEENELLSQQELHLFVTGNRWKYSPNTQMELVYKYLSPEDIDQEIYNKNDYPEVGINIQESRSDAIDNDDKVWIHPFRNNQYSFTEVCPFPEIQKPFEIDNSWTSSLDIGEGWGKWSNMSGTNSYKITEIDSIKLSFTNKIEKVLVIDAKSNFPIGRSKAKFKFSKIYGFVSIEYDLYNDERLIMRLTDVID